MIKPKPSTLLAAFCWVNFAALMWIVLLGIIEPSNWALLAAVLFLLAAISASAVASSRQVEDD